MKERPDTSPWLRLLGTAIFSLALASPFAMAQDAVDDVDDGLDDDVREEIVVTGSRLRRDTFSSVAPLQVITGEVSRNLGAIDPGTIMQDSSASAGVQFDTTFGGFVLDNGPGASTADLRGLGASRTLVLLNGRRISPAGVEGVPIAPDLNVLPSTLVSRYEILLDGASSIYGSDAVAGVANVILRKDFDGLELEAYTRMPEHSNGIENTISVAWGANFDRGFIGIGAEYSDGEAVTYADRPWTADCATYRERTPSGEIRTTNISYAEQYGMKETPCVTSFGSQRVFDNNGQFGSIYFTEGTSNVGIPNWSEATGPFDIVLDQDGDGQPDVDFTDYFIASEDNTTHLLPDRERVSIMAYGEYTFEGDMNITPYFEATYNKRETYFFDAGAVIQEEVIGENPYNICNPDGVNGTDCWLAYDNIWTNPQYIAEFQQALLFGGGTISVIDACLNFFDIAQEDCTPGAFGLTPAWNDFLPGGGPGVPRPLEAQFSIAGDRNQGWIEVDQVRFVGGLKGDLPMLNVGSLDNMGFDIAYVLSESKGTSLRPGVREDRLEYSLNTSRIENGQVVCGTPDGGPCVPVNVFAPSLYQGLLSNELATQAERDFLFADRFIDTRYKQAYVNLLLTGDVFELPAGSVGMAIGYEFRNDDIESLPNEVASEGQLWGFFKDKGATGEKDTKEWFVEVEVPILAGVTGFEELTANVSTRHTDDEFYGGAWTYSGKLSWRPIDSLLLRGTIGTSYRAPNLRENFLEGLSGFATGFDPCVVPSDALILDIDGGLTYDPGLDNRSPVVIQNCIDDGVDPTTLGIVAANATSSPFVSVEVLQFVGQTGLDEEKSESWTAGFAWEQPYFEAFDLSIGATYYEIEIRDEIVQFSFQGAINDCYDDSEGDSPFCQAVRREDLGGGMFGLIEEVDQNFINRDSLKARGVDVNLALDWPTSVFGKAVDFAADLNFNRKLELSDLFISDIDGSVSADSDLGELGVPEWEGQGIFRADFGDYRLTWATRYLSNAGIDPDVREDWPFSGAAWYGEGDSWTCAGEARGDVDCQPVGEVENYFRHDLSFYYYGDVYTVGFGARNVFDEEPPLIDGRVVVYDRSNVPLGRGYDVQGRQYFINVSASFDDLSF
ncbi:MAG: TonB-dependent receptor [Woeseiaceae bacterium]|nr:TonB-dependent receptor [Gammaproteobacteria bacterium]NNK25548.1 TonB-dependent receptor [Woeseiaceae bacterium]